MAVARSERGIAFAGIGANFDEATRPGCIELDGTRIGLGAIGIVTGDMPAASRRPEEAGAGLLPQPARLRDGGRPAGGHASRLPHPLDPLRARGPRGAGRPPDHRLARLRRRAEGHRPHRRPSSACGAGRRAERQVADLLRARQFHASGHHRDDALRHLPRLWADGQGASRARRRGLAGRRHRGDPADQDRYAARSASRPPTPRRASMRSTIWRASSTTASRLMACASRRNPTARGSIARKALPSLAASCGKLCQGWQEASAPPQEIAAQIDAACEDKPFYGKPALTKRRGTRPSRRASPPSPFGSFR